MEDERPKRRRASNKPARYQQDDDDDVSSPPVSNNKNGSSNKKAHNNINIDNNETTPPSAETAVASTKTSSRRRASNKPARYNQDDDEDKVPPAAAGSSSNTKKKTQNKNDNGGKKKAPSSKAVASAKTSSSLGGEDEPKKKTARIKIRLSVGAKKGGGGEKGGGSVASKSSSTSRGKKRKAEDVKEVDSVEGKQQVKVRVRVDDKPCKGVCYAQLPSSSVNNMEVEEKNVKKKGKGGGRKGKQQVKVQVRVNDKPCKEGVCYAQLPSSAMNDIEVKEKNVKKKGKGGRKGKRKKEEEEEMEESSDEDQVDEIDEDDIVEDDEDEDMGTSSEGGGAFTSAKLKQPWRLCKVQTCNMYKKARSDGYCLTHWREYNPGMDPPSGAVGFSRASSSTQPNAGKGCKVSGCTNKKSPKKDGYCATCWLAYQPADDVGGEKKKEEESDDGDGGKDLATSSDLSEKKDEEMKNARDVPQDSLAQDPALSAVASSPAASTTPKVVLVVEHLVLNSNVSFQELRDSTRDIVKRIVNKAGIFFGNQFWQDIKSLLTRAIDAIENGEKLDHDSLIQMYASSNHSAPIAYGLGKPREPWPKSEKVANAPTPPRMDAKPPPIEDSSTPKLAASSSTKKQTKSKKKNLCKYPDCTRVIQTNCKGYCLTHVNYINYEEGDVTNVTKVRVRINTRLENGFRRATLPIELREKWGFPRGSSPEGMTNAGNEIDTDAKMKTEEKMEEEDDTKPPAAGGDEMELDEPMPQEKDTNVYGPAANQKAVFQEKEVVKDLYECPFPGCLKTNLTRNGIAAHYGMKHGGSVDISTCRVVGSRIIAVKKKPAAAFAAAPMDIDNGGTMPQLQANHDTSLKPIEIDPNSIDLQAVLDFEISLTTIKKASGANKCRAIDCPKNQQGNAGGFCRAHHNRYLICTGQCGSWICKCGNKVADIQSRCGTCHRWKDGKHSTSSGNTPSKADQFRSGMVKGNIADSMFAVDLEDDEDNAVVNDGKDWACDNCGKIIPGKKSRCGNCHRWRGGKRLGGWKLGKPMGRDEDSNDGIDRTQDWTCCGEILPAAKTRCGKCNKWRGGKRIAAKEVDWDCAKCGITIDGGLERCGGCLTWKNATKTKSKPSNLQSSSGNWRCNNTKCNFDNFASELFCYNCQGARPNYKWHKKQQLTSGVGESQATATKGGGYPVQAAAKMASQVSAPEARASSAVATQPTTAIPSVITVPSQGASAAVSMEQPDIRVRVDTAEGSEIVPINYPPDNLNYYGSIHEGLGDPYISLHYDFNRAYYHNCQYNYLDAGLGRAAGSSQNGENTNTDDNKSSSPSGSTNKGSSDNDDKDEDLSDDNVESIDSDAEKK